MCLKTVFNINKMPEYKEAYKIFYKEQDNDLRGVSYYFNFKKRRWLKDINDYTIEADDCTEYKCGFHCYINKSYALKCMRTKMRSTCVAHRVLVKNIVAYGIQDVSYSLTIVAKEIFIMEEIYGN